MDVLTSSSLSFPLASILHSNTAHPHALYTSPTHSLKDSVVLVIGVHDVMQHINTHVHQCVKARGDADVSDREEVGDGQTCQFATLDVGH